MEASPNGTPSIRKLLLIEYERAHTQRASLQNVRSIHRRLALPRTERRGLCPQHTRNLRDLQKQGSHSQRKKLVIGMTKVPIAGHEVDSLGLNMSQARIDSTIAFTKPASFKELSFFLGLLNYFRDHLRNHSRHSHYLHDMVAAANKNSSKTTTWTDDALHGFEKLKTMVNARSYTSLTAYTRSYSTQTRQITHMAPTYVR